jgi:hypothetical protein
VVGSRFTVAACVTSALVALAPTTADAGRERPRPRCSVAGRVVLRTPLIKVVRREQGDPDEGQVVRLLGCAFSTNRIRTLAEENSDFTNRGGVSVGRHAGTWVATSTSHSNQYGSRQSTWVTDIRTGRRYLLYSNTVDRGTPFPPEVLERFFLNDRGQAAAAFNTLTPGSPDPSRPVVSRTTIAAVSNRGVRADLDSGTPEELPARSLMLDRRLFIWMHSGQVRYAWL